jgi:hypothetical protein
MLRFYCEELLVPRPTLQAGGLSLVGCPLQLIQYIRYYPPYLKFSIRNLKTRRAVVTGNSLTAVLIMILLLVWEINGSF